MRLQSTAICQNCGVTFSPHHSSIGKYCSWHCRGVGRIIPAEERFWAKVHKTGDCWLWTGARLPKGYGRFGIDKRTVSAHRFSYELHFGLIPDNLWVLHHCDNPSCVYPEHLYLGTHHDNMRDAKERNRTLTGQRNPQNKLTPDDVRSIRRIYADGDISQTQLATKYGIQQTTVRDIIHRRIWRHVQ